METIPKPAEQEKGPLVRFATFFLKCLLYTFLAFFGLLIGLTIGYYLLAISWFSILIGMNSALRFAIYLQDWAFNLQPALELF